MKHETLTRLIEGATPDQMKAIARLVLRLSGYPPSRITDGPYDGGTDFVIEQPSGSPLPVAVALSIEKDWRKKIHGDVEKARRKLGVETVLFISSRRIPEGTFRPEQTKVLDAFSVRVDRIDQQGIAELVMGQGALPALLEALDISSSGGGLPTRPSDRRRDAAYAFAFFAPEVRSFRKSVRDRSLLVALAQAGGRANVDELCVDASRLLGMEIDDAMALRHDLDRMRGQGKVLGRNGIVMLTDTERATMDALRTLRHRDEATLRDELRSPVESIGLDPPADALDALMHGLGAFTARHVGAPQSLEHLHAHARRLRRELEAFGLPHGGRGDRFVEQVIELARASDFGQSLATGSVYQALTSFDRSALLRALDAQSIAFVLDASVAIPMFCALFQGSIEQRFFLVAEELHRKARRTELPLQLPDVWLEEMASHLLKAREYAALVSDEDLRQSKNAYVAYYAASRRRGRTQEFSRFLESFGLTEALGRRAEGDWVGARRELEIFLRRQLLHYGIGVVPTKTDRQHLDRAAQDWVWACHQLDIDDRSPLLQRHDQRVLAWLSSSTEHDPSHAPLIATWDRILRRARPESAAGGALDPLALVELLSFVSDSREPAMTARFAALQLTEAEAERGAAILDTLISFEHPNLSDAELLQKATAFKREYLSNQQAHSNVAALERDWQSFQDRT